MRYFKEGLKKGCAAILLLTLVPFLLHTDAANAQDGEKLFKANCASCHKADAKLIGPPLKGARERWGESVDLIYLWVKNPKEALATGDPYVKKIWEYDASEMTPQALTNEEIDAVLDWADAYVPPAPKGGEAVADAGPAVQEEETNVTAWMLIIGVVLLVIILSLGGVNRQLAVAVSAKKGEDTPEDLGYLATFKAWAWKNKKFVTVCVIFLLAVGAVDLWGRLAGIGVYQGYQPEQPINFSHKVHAGEHKIDCQYCHSSVEKSKHSMIPSPMVCMNCHRGIQEGTNTGTEEIAKIYKATGFSPEENAYVNEPQPIKWVKVHNLADFVYFNHSQHVKVGKLECQECHGPVEEMGVAQQHSEMTMGWCINCHNETAVDMTSNEYYEEIHNRMSEDLLKKYLQDERITVKELGGWECAKCHY